MKYDTIIFDIRDFFQNQPHVCSLRCYYVNRIFYPLSQLMTSLPAMDYSEMQCTVTHVYDYRLVQFSAAVDRYFVHKQPITKKHNTDAITVFVVMTFNVLLASGAATR